VSRRNRSPVFVGALTFCAALAAGELFLIYERWSAARDAAAKLVARQTELMAMATTMPPPTREISTAIEEDLARAQTTLAAMQAELKGRGPAAERLRTARVPTARTDAYFDLASYVERLRERARKNEVAIRPEAARFGFAAHANEGPELERIEPVFRQRLLAQYLMECLLDARPRAILAVKRELALTAPEREAREASAAEAVATVAAVADGGDPADTSSLELEVPEGPDYFAIDPRVSARKAGFVDTIAFKFVFTGQTAALRSFLNRLASFELPVLVREVEVELTSNEEAADFTSEEPAEPESGPTAINPAPSSVVLSVYPEPSASVTSPTPPASAGRAPARRTTEVPIVTKSISKFTVTVEFVELVTPPPPPEEAPAPS